MNSLILSKYHKQITNVIVVQPDANIQCTYYDPGYDEDRIKRRQYSKNPMYAFKKDTVTLATFNRTLEQFNTQKSVYTELGKLGTMYNGKEYVFTSKYNQISVKDYPFTLSHFVSITSKEIRNEPQIFIKRDVTKYSFAGNYNINIYFYIIDEKEFSLDWINKERDYKIVLEYTSEADKSNLKDKLIEFYKYNNILLKFIQDTEKIYTLQERASVATFFNKILHLRKQNSDYTLDKDVLVKARNLKLRDMVYGGLVGNEKTAYRVTAKADGNRKILLIHETGYWLVNPPYEFKYLAELNNYTDYIGSAFDCELMRAKPKGNILEADDGTYPKSKYIILLFDVLSNPDRNGYLGNAIQNTDKTTRLSYIDTYLDDYNNFLTELSKTKNRVNFFTDRNYRKPNDEMQNDELIPLLGLFRKESWLFNTVPEFYNIMRYLFDYRFWYKIDGYMIEPEAAPYNSRTERLPLREQILTLNPQICKVKPIEEQTMDFAIYIENGIPVLYGKISRNKYNLNYSLINHNLQKFVGTEINPYTPEILDLTGLENMVDRTIAEFKFADGKLKLKHIRTNKDEPNNIDVINEIWNDIHRPIREKTLLGESDQLVRYYHNSIKRELFKSDKGRTLLDIGAGKGATVNEYKKYDRILCVEPNENSILELQRRVDTLGLSDESRLYKIKAKTLQQLQRQL